MLFFQRINRMDFVKEIPQLPEKEKKSLDRE